MVEKGPYEILPYAEIDQLKKEIEGLKKKTASSQEILDAMGKQTKVMEDMLYLFESAAAGMKKEGEGHEGRKLDKIIDQHESIAESILSLFDIVKKIRSELEIKDEDKAKVGGRAKNLINGLENGPRMSGRPSPIRQPPLMPPPPKPDLSFPPPSLEEPPMRGPLPPPLPPGDHGPVPMPTGSFKDLNLDLPETKGFSKKKGLFGKFKMSKSHQP